MGAHSGVRSNLRLKSLLLPALLLATPAVAHAQEVLTEISPEAMAKLLTSMGLEVEPVKQEGDSANPALNLELGGYRVVLFLANGNTDAQLFAGFSDAKVKKDKINEWNQRHRFGRAYIDKDGDPVLESDIDFTGGVTRANIKAWVKIYRDLLVEFAKSVN